MQGFSDRFVKNCLIRCSLVCSTFFTIFCFSPLVLAVGPSLEMTGASPVITPVEGNILWDQSDNLSDTDIASQDFVDGGDAFDIFDARGADDFLVPDDLMWSIETIKVFGVYVLNPVDPDPVESLDIVFFRNEGGLPGDEIKGCVYKDVLPEDLNDSNFVINLPKPCKLRQGTYWVSVQANLEFLPNGQWFWNERTVQTLSPFAWENPGDGFGSGCLTFASAQAECGATFPDLTFQLLGEEQPFNVVPTLSQWGLIALAVALGIVGIVVYRKRKLTP